MSPRSQGRLGLMPARHRVAAARAAGACRAAPSSSASTGRAARRPTASSSSTRSRARTAPTDDGPRLGLSVSRRVGGAVDRTRVKRVLREAFWQEAERLPDGSDYVVVARPESLGLTEREGTPGIRRALGELVEGMGGARPARGATSPHERRDPHRPGPDPPVPARDLARAAAALQVPPDLLGLRGAGDPQLRHTARRRAGGLAAPALQSVQPRRLRPRVRPDPLPTTPRSAGERASNS